jgi:hypothetical protein
VDGKDPAETLEMKLWVALAEESVLFSPGWFFAADRENEGSDARGEGHFRISFSNASVSGTGSRHPPGPPRTPLCLHLTDSGLNCSGMT